MGEKARKWQSDSNQAVSLKYNKLFGGYYFILNVIS